MVKTKFEQIFCTAYCQVFTAKLCPRVFALESNTRGFTHLQTSKVLILQPFGSFFTYNETASKFNNSYSFENLMVNLNAIPSLLRWMVQWRWFFSFSFPLTYAKLFFVCKIYTTHVSNWMLSSIFLSFLGELFGW